MLTFLIKGKRVNSTKLLSVKYFADAEPNRVSLQGNQFDSFLDYSSVFGPELKIYYIVC